MRTRPVYLLQHYVCLACRIRRYHSSPQLNIDKVRGGQATSQSAKSLHNVDHVEKRISTLGGRERMHDFFPRWPLSMETSSTPAAHYASEVSGRWGVLLEKGQAEITCKMTVYGRLTSYRKLGSNLVFLDLHTGNGTTQAVLNYQKINDIDDGVSKAEFTTSHRRLQRGDWIAVRGHQYRPVSGQVSLLATELPRILSPALQPVPLELSDPEFRMRNRHAEYIVNPSSRDVLVLRHKIIQGLRTFFESRDFVEVSTPLLVGEEGGAIARPFETEATEFPGVKLKLRVAPELYLKRLVVGGMERVFEIGPAFRNEGLDLTHNPEFTICEFYQIMLSLDELMSMTAHLFSQVVQIAKKSELLLAQDLDQLDFTSTFRTLEFVPALEQAIRRNIQDWTFPDLGTASALQSLQALFERLEMPTPVPITLPRMLDALSAAFLEPQCEQPTFILHHPECMSPLAKSFETSYSPTVTHRVSARAELFIRGREYVNCYEEENSPFEQRRKFEQQARWRAAGDQEIPLTIDEDYLRALEWGLPPTGGWGCGVDRLVMLLSGKSRIADVLPFGNLRNVVGRSMT